MRGKIGMKTPLLSAVFFTVALSCLLLTVTLRVYSSSTINADDERMLQMIAMEKNDSARLNLMIEYFSNTEQSSPERDIQKAQKLLLQSQKFRDRTGEVYALTQIGLDYRSFGNSTASLKYYLKALSLAEASGNMTLIAPVYNDLGNIYRDRSDYRRAIDFYLRSELAAVKGKNFKVQSWALRNKGEAYLLMNRIDSALIYTQEAYELSMQIGYDNYLSDILAQLGSVHAQLGNGILALSYYKLAIAEAEKNSSIKSLNQCYTAMAKYFATQDQQDSCLWYAKKAVGIVEHTAYSNWRLAPAKLLASVYKGSDCDSALKYANMFRLANDSLFSVKSIQQMQMLTFEDDLRRQEAAAEKVAEEEEREANIQYVLIAISIVTFVILYLLLSRRFIANPKLVAFLGVVALLIMFEFLNLLLHPFLERITNHSPLLMLLSLVVIAALLIPVHHRLEKWTRDRLVKKNNEIRLRTKKIHAKSQKEH